MPTMAEQEKKIIIDEDWKHQAQKEKELEAAKAREEAATKAEQEESHGRQGPLPKADIAGLINMLATQALFAMGVFQVKDQDPREPDLDLARYNIDMLEALEGKTKGNLSKGEAGLLKETLNQLRMGFVQIAQGGSMGPEEPE